MKLHIPPPRHCVEELVVLGIPCRGRGPFEIFLTAGYIANDEMVRAWKREHPGFDSTLAALRHLTDEELTELRERVLANCPYLLPH